MTLHLQDELNELTKMYEEEKTIKASVAGIKDVLRDDVLLLKSLTEEKESVEIALKKLNEKISKIESNIRSAWEPVIRGTDKSSIEINGVLLLSEKVMNISADDKDVAIDWFSNNGHTDVLKYTIHHQTMCKIARDELANGQTIPGLKYSEFTKIKVK